MRLYASVEVRVCRWSLSRFSLRYGPSRGGRDGNRPSSSVLHRDRGGGLLGSALPVSKGQARSEGGLRGWQTVQQDLQCHSRARNRQTRNLKNEIGAYGFRPFLCRMEDARWTVGQGNQSETEKTAIGDGGGIEDTGEGKECWRRRRGCRSTDPASM